MAINIATCGHRVTWAWLPDGTVKTKYVSREGKRVVDTRVLCPMCLGRYTREGLIIKNKREEQRWLKSGK